MFQLIYGDIWDSQCDAIVLPINCTATLNSEIAKGLIQNIPGLLENHERLVRNGFVQPGELTLFKAPSGILIVGVPTKRHWRSKCEMADILAGLRGIRFFLGLNAQVKSIAIPDLTCEDGGADWEAVYAAILRELRGAPVRIDLYPPVARGQ